VSAVGEGRCKEFAAFGWKSNEVPHPQARETFEESKLKWTELERSPHAEMLGWHKQLIRLRHDETDLSDGEMKKVSVEFNENESWLVMQRGLISVACNLSRHSQQIPLQGRGHQVLLASEPGVNLINKNIVLAAESVAICKGE
jgi:maltooligosyltrehalose trehalohydrolase